MNYKKYCEDGYAIINIEKMIGSIDKLKLEIYQLFSTISEQYDGQVIKSDSGIIDLYKKNSKLQHQAVKHLWNLPRLFEFGGSDYFKDILTDFGLKKPNLQFQPLLRCDMPITDQKIFDTHQDYTYNMGSNNSVTFWIPLQDTSDQMGALLVEPGSHTKGVYENKGGIILNKYNFNMKSIPILKGEALVFNQKLVHKSGFNTSNNIRFSMQLRYTDMSEESYINKEYYLNNVFKVLKYANKNE